MSLKLFMSWRENIDKVFIACNPESRTASYNTINISVPQSSLIDWVRELNDSGGRIRYDSTAQYQPLYKWSDNIRPAFDEANLL